jgi:hypothetical protein
MMKMKRMTNHIKDRLKKTRLRLLKKKKTRKMRKTAPQNLSTKSFGKHLAKTLSLESLKIKETELS